LIGKANVTVTSALPGVPDAEVLKTSISNNILTIHTQPLTPYAAYFVTFKSTDTTIFKSLDGASVLLEDGRTNVIQILGPEEPENPIRNNIVSFLKDNVYDLNRGTIVRLVVDQIATNLLRARTNIRRAKNDNYLRINIFDENKTRSRGPFDRLNEEGAFIVTRVGKQPTGTTASGNIPFDSFPFYPVTLLQTSIYNENLIEGNQATSKTFDKLILTLGHSPVTKANRILIKYQAGGSFNYDIRTFGYLIQNPKYDQAFASTLLTLEDNQIKLSDAILDQPGFKIPGTGDEIVVDYEYKFLGRIIDEASVQVSQVLDAVREPTPAIINSFSLAHAPIVTDSDQIATSGGVQFLDPNSATPFLTIHPAFTKEIPFRYGGVPSNPGEYSVDYSSGKVFVFGASSSHDGTGNYPPAATYKYRNIFKSGLDYTYVSGDIGGPINDLAANPLRDLIGQEAKISFNYEDTLVPGVDYNPLVHQEVIDERIENRLKTTNSLSVLNSTITNVFRIFNETTGEVYPPTRFNDDTVFFNFKNPPRISDAIRERASFTNVLNETLLTSDTFTNILGTRVFKIQLLNNRIMSITDDVIGSNFNSSVQFSKTSVFAQELYYDGQILSVTANTDRLSVGDYQIDYRNGTIYVGVSVSQDFDIGTINYKKSVVQPNNLHLISVSNIYYSTDITLGPTKVLDYVSFGDNEILPSSFDVSDERFFNNDVTQPYIVSSGTIMVMDDIKSVRHIFDVYDLNNNDVPTDFAEGATSQANIITLSPDGVQKQETLVVGSGLTLTVSFISPGIEVGDALSAVRISDGYQLLDDLETIVGNVITLSATSGAVVGDVVNVLYTVILNGGATPVVDYNRGDYFIDYTYLADEILVSYEFGDNSLDFRDSHALDAGDQYYVTYQAGALRDSLLSNFGSLVDIPELNAFDTSLPRESYRDALTGALQSFTKGPTIPAMSEVVSSITKITPQIIEALFDVWSLGVSHLFLKEIKVNGDLPLVAGKFDQGILITAPGESVSFPVSSNIRLDAGTFETWIIPEWDGLDNDATLTFSNILRDGYELSSANIYIGASSFNPSFDDSGNFTLNRTDSQSPIGLPSAVFTSIGMFIYYDDIAKRWNVLAKDIPNDGYDGYVYSGTITSSGEVYDVKFIPNLGEPDDVLRSGINKINFEFHLDVLDYNNPDGYADGYDGYADGYVPGYSFDGITFMADEQHYIFDFAETKDKNRFSIYKDGSGYLNFSVWDRGGRFQQKKTRRNEYKVSADIQNWKAGEKHHIATSWILNSSDRRDELHLFIDGFEVPNIIRYGGRPTVTSTDRFRIVKPELVAGVVPLTAIVGSDLVTTQGSDIVVSPSNDFSASGILPGNTIEIKEQGFTTYTILAVSGSSLQLNTTMPASLQDAVFSVNPYSVVVSSEIDLFSNIAVSILSGGVETEIPGLRATLPAYEISKNMLNQNVLTLLGNAEAGDQILIRTLGLNHRRCREKVFLWGNTQAVLKTNLPPPINLDEVSIRAVLLPYTVIGPGNATLTLGNFVATGIQASQPTSAAEGRRLEVRITGGNVDFSTQTMVTINGTTATGPLFEILNFSAPGIQNTSLKFKTISSIDVQTTPINTTTNGIALEIKEMFSVTVPDGNSIYPVIRFAFKTQLGNSLEGDGSTTVSDFNGFFALSNINNLLVINSPLVVAGTYTITNRIDNTSITVTPAPGTAFSGGTYDIYNASIGRSGFQNGFFFLEQAGATNVAYPIPQGFYEFDYSSYLEVPFDPLNQMAYVGNSFEQNKPAKAVIDELRISSRVMTDTRVGETIPTNQESITTDFLNLRAFRPNNTTLMLLHFDSMPLINDSNYYSFSTREFVQSSTSVNANFSQSIMMTDKGMFFDNDGRLTTRSEGTIEFWVSPRFDTYNDPVPRFYFDATSSTVEEVVSLTKGTVKVSGTIETVLSVRLQTDTTDSGTDYFAGGIINADRQTITLNRALPYQRTPVKVTYIPSGLVGDRISILKDSSGFIAFNVRAQGKDVQVRQPVFWPRDSWHRIKATYKFNRPDNKDEIRLFVDGEERGVVLFGSGLLFGQGFIFGQTTVGVTNQILVTDINFTDPINQFVIGSDFIGGNSAQARMDNFRLSNISRAPISVAGQPYDTNFNSNTDMSFPVIEDAFTTFLLNFDSLLQKVTDFAILRDAQFGIFNFTINVIDSFNLVRSSPRMQQILTSMILALKPATSKAQINIIA
jgi:hypothetical protein